MTVHGITLFVIAAVGPFTSLVLAAISGLVAAYAGATGDRDKAVAWAARAGQVVGGLLVLLGMLQLFLVRGGGFGGLWLAVIGWFLMTTAQAEVVEHRIKGLLGDRTVGDIARGLPEPLPAGTSVSDVQDRMVSSPWEIQPVIGDDGQQHVVTTDDLVGVPREERTRTEVGEIIGRREEMPSIRQDTPAAEALADLDADRSCWSPTPTAASRAC